MAKEIIVGERGNGQFQFYFLYVIPPASRIEIGGTGVTGEYPVLTPSTNLSADVLLVLTQAEKDALDAGEAVLIQKNVAIPEGYNDAQVLALAQQVYATNGPEALAAYTHRFQYYGRRFDKA